ncbi:MAG: lysylphosphatidylglycerol synthase domain-containing protein [Gemmatimonadota bacterium]|nr:lysylphosphatidylglycerol synthase domain-containing protein [Gemmatimonadota bacterium]
MPYRKCLQLRSRLSRALPNFIAVLRWNLFTDRDLWESDDNPIDTPPQLSFLKASHAILVGYPATNVISRAGEIVRGVALQKDRRLPLSGVLATILVERAIDMLALLIFLSGVLYFTRHRIAAARP